MPRWPSFPPRCKASRPSFRRPRPIEEEAHAAETKARALAAAAKLASQELETELATLMKLLGARA